MSSVPWVTPCTKESREKAVGGGVWYPRESGHMRISKETRDSICSSSGLPTGLGRKGARGAGW